MTAFCQHIPWPIKPAVLANTDISVKPNIGGSPMHRSICSFNAIAPLGMTFLKSLLSLRMLDCSFIEVVRS